MPKIAGLNFDELTAWEVRNKGWYGLVRVELDSGVEVPLMFYDPVRLRQTLDSDFQRGEPYFAEPNVVILPELTEDAMRSAVTDLIATGYFTRFEAKP